MKYQKYKVVFIPMFGGNAQYEEEFDTSEKAEQALKTIADYTLLLHECSLMPDYSNIGMVCGLDDDGEWVEIDADEEEI